MVTLVLLVLNWLGIIGFSWWIPLIESVVLAVTVASTSEKGAIGGDIIANIALGCAVFAGLKLFCGLTLSAWWMLAWVVIGPLSILFPGGLTLVNLFLRDHALATVPTWCLVTGVVIDVIMMVLVGYVTYDHLRTRRRRRNSRRNRRRR